MTSDPDRLKRNFVFLKIKMHYNITFWNELKISRESCLGNVWPIWMEDEWESIVEWYPQPGSKNLWIRGLICWGCAKFFLLNISKQVGREGLELNFCWSLQLDKYETAPNFIQLSQNLTSDCLLIFVYLPVFTGFCMMCSWNCSADHNKTVLWAHHAKTGKNK